MSSIISAFKATSILSQQRSWELQKTHSSIVPLDYCDILTEICPLEALVFEHFIPQGVTLPKKVHHWRWALKVENLMLIAAYFLCFLLVVKMWALGFLFLLPSLLLTAMPLCHDGSSHSSRTISQNNLSSTSYVLFWWFITAMKNN